MAMIMMIVVFFSIFLTIISILLLLGATMLMVVCSNTLSYLLYILINPRPLKVLHINEVLSVQVLSSTSFHDKLLNHNSTGTVTFPVCKIRFDPKLIFICRN